MSVEEYLERQAVTNEIKKILRDSSLDPAIETTLQRVFLKLGKHEEKMLRSIVERLKCEQCSKQENQDGIWNVSVILASDDVISELTNSGYRIIETGRSLFFRENAEPNVSCEKKYQQSILQGPCFLQCTYDEFEKFCRTYRGRYVENGEEHIFRYQILPQYRFVEQEKVLYEVVHLYDITKPIIFSPYARRAIDLCILDNLSPEICQHIDFCWEKNGLAGKVITGHQLLWNIDIEDEDALPVSGNPADHEYIYTDGIDENTYILPVEKCEFVYKKSDRICIKFSEGGIPAVCQRVALRNISAQNEADVFQNIFYKSNNPKAHLRTRADIEYVLSAFTMPEWGFSCEFAHIGKQMDGVLPIYRKEHRYPEDKDQLIYADMWSRPYVYVRFRGEKLFLIDYANYVLNYLQQIYPEFNWAGVHA